jgi:hypothetical protein
MALRARWPYYVDMNNPERVHEFLSGLLPDAICDDCLAEQAAVQPPNQASPITRTLALTRDFERVKGCCSVCKVETKYVTRALVAA